MLYHVTKVLISAVRQFLGSTFLIAS